MIYSTSPSGLVLNKRETHPGPASTYLNFSLEELVLQKDFFQIKTTIFTEPHNSQRLLDKRANVLSFPKQINYNQLIIQFTGV